MHLFLFAKISPKAPFYDQAKQAILNIIPATLQEPGCYQFALHEGQGDGCLYLYEEFEDEAALAAHYETSYTKEVFAQYQDWLEKPVDVVKMNLCGK